MFIPSKFSALVRAMKRTECAGNSDKMFEHRTRQLAQNEFFSRFSSRNDRVEYIWNFLVHIERRRKRCERRRENNRENNNNIFRH